MSIPVSWAIALAVAAAMGGVLLLAVGARRGLVALPEQGLAHVAYLLGGGVAGFTALAFYPAWPLLAAVVGMLVVQAARLRKVLDIGLLMVGFGGAWTLLKGLAIWNDLSDPAVSSPGDDTRWLAFAVAILLAGLVVAIAGWVAPIRRPTERG